MNKMLKKAYFSHGKESGPWGTKIRRLAGIARQFGYQVESIDYRGIETVEKRAEKLVASFKPGHKNILIGSSMGAAVSIYASQTIELQGCFLMAPAVYMPGYELVNIPVKAPQVDIVHGWSDEIVPVESAIRYARENNYRLTLVDDEHRLSEKLDHVEVLFRQFLKSV
jgi:alpha/beta superfamily hydrolase